MSLNFIQCIYLIDDCIKNDLIQQDPDDPNRILVYCMEGTPPEKYPEGWYSENIFDTARELMGDPKEQQFLADALKDAGVVEPSCLNLMLTNILS